MTLPSRAVRRARAAAGWAARHAGLTPEARKAKIDAQCALARESRWKGHVKKDRRLPSAEEILDVPGPAEELTTGEWETIGEDPDQ